MSKVSAVVTILVEQQSETCFRVEMALPSRRCVRSRSLWILTGPAQCCTALFLLPSITFSIFLKPQCYLCTSRHGPIM